MAISLDYEAIVDETGRRLGFDPNPPDLMSSGLRVLLAEVERRGALTREGRRLLQHEIIRVMTQRSMLEDRMAQASDVVDGEVLVITGLPRTRSTLLHNMLADLGVYSWLPLWRALEPAVPEDHGEFGAIGRAETHLRFMDALSPDLRRVHPMRADRPDECITLMQLTGASDRFSISLTVPEYRDWTMGGEVVEETYRDYARLLNVMFGRRRPILLKAPSHARHVEVLRRRLPQASIVWLQRDVDEVEASFRRLVSASRRVFQTSTDAGDWVGCWRGIDPPTASHILDHEDTPAFVQLAAAAHGFGAPSPLDYADWLRPTPSVPR